MDEVKINILFTSVGKRVELIQLWQKAFSDLGIKGRIIGVDLSPLGPAVYFLDQYYRAPRIGSKEYIPFLEQVCEQERIDIIFPLLDHDLPVLASARDSFLNKGFRLVVCSLDSINKTQDKWLTYHMFDTLGLKSPKSWLLRDLDKIDKKDTLFIKPRVGSASRDTYKISSTQELEFYTNQIPNPIIQECLNGPEITTDVICDLINGEVLGIVSRERLETRSGEVTKGRTIRDARIIDGCFKIVRHIKAIGPITVQCMMHDGKPYFTEVNARYGGGAPLGIISGVNSPAWYLSKHFDLEINIPEIGEYRNNLYMLRYDSAVYLKENELFEH